MQGKKLTRKMAALATGAVLLLGGNAGGGPFVITDATDTIAMDSGAVYRILGPGQIETVASGLPLQSPSGVLFRDHTALGEEYFVSDIGTFFGLGDGAIHLVGDGQPTTVVYQGPPLSSPFGMLLGAGHRLYVGDFGNPAFGIMDGAVYVLDLDPDADGQEGPFPLPPSALQPVWVGAPLAGVNQIAWRTEGHVITVADDSGSLFDLDLDTAAPPTAFGPPFVDPVGLAREAAGFIVSDAGAQEIYRIDAAGTNATLLLAGTFLDQFLGVAAEAPDTVIVPNSHNLFSPATDGDVIQMTAGSTSVPYSGPPLVNPFSAAFPRPPRSANSGR